MGSALNSIFEICGNCLETQQNIFLFFVHTYDKCITYQFGVHWVWAHNLTMHALGILFNHSYCLSYLTKLVMVFLFIFIFTFHIHIHFRGGFLFHIHWFSYIWLLVEKILFAGLSWLERCQDQDEMCSNAGRRINALARHGRETSSVAPVDSACFTGRPEVV